MNSLLDPNRVVNLLLVKSIKQSERGGKPCITMEFTEKLLKTGDTVTRCSRDARISFAHRPVQVMHLSFAPKDLPALLEAFNAATKRP
jgi:hypothetical protein